jgi:FKBP-type peptidyl-prolyl cis-trans isomerase (trigger factor)
MISAIQRQENGTIQLTITIPSEAVKKAWNEVVEEGVKNMSVPGFRKGKAPKQFVEEKIDKEKVREDVLKKLLPKFYSDAIRENNLTPIINPKIHIGKLEDPVGESGKGWQFTALTCEAPEVKLNDYEQNIQKITARSKIIVPGKDKQEVKFEDIVRALLESVTIKIPEILIEREVERLLAQTLDDIKKLGLTLDQYLSSTNKTPEGLRDEYKKKAESDIRLEFALQKIATEERITVEEKEVDEAIRKAKDEKERKHLESNRYLLASILRQQKTLDFLKNL